MAKMILESKTARKLLTNKQISNYYSSKVDKKPKVKRMANGSRKSVHAEFGICKGKAGENNV